MWFCVVISNIYSYLCIKLTFMNGSDKLWFVFSEGRLLLEESPGKGFRIPRSVDKPSGTNGRMFSIGCMDGAQCVATSAEGGLPSGLCPVGLRASFDLLPVQDYLMAGKASQILNFDRERRFCSICGSPLEYGNDIMRRCPSCGREFYPTLTPAVMVRVTRGNEILMVRSHNFKGRYYGMIAGFLEIGETLEECVRREVREETGIEIKNLKYFKSQSWPYPTNIMVGFTADYASGRIKIQEEELSSGGWFHRDKMPEVPKKLSLARMLIDDWLGE